jgi:hypothetical protein
MEELALTEADTLSKFAADLRIYAEGKSGIDDLLKKATRAYGHAPSRSALFAALFGYRLPREATLNFLIKSWADGGVGSSSQRARRVQQECRKWEERRRALYVKQRRHRKPAKDQAQWVSIPTPQKQLDLAALLAKRIGNQDLDELADHVGVASHRLQAYLTGKSIPGRRALNLLMRGTDNGRYDGSQPDAYIIGLTAEEARKQRINDRRKARLSLRSTGDTEAQAARDSASVRLPV